jgi:hypothetical protein
MIGKVYNIPPQPPAPENTRYLPAGAITFGIEYRDVDPESLAATLTDDPRQLAELEEQSPPGGFSDEGVSIHVCGTDDGHEYVRFDVFDDEPHYHYIHRTPAGAEIVNNVIDFDSAAQGEMLPWAIDRLRTRLPAMLTEAEGGHLVPQLDNDVVTRVIDEVGSTSPRRHNETVARRPTHNASPSTTLTRADDTPPPTPACRRATPKSSALTYGGRVDWGSERITGDMCVSWPSRPTHRISVRTLISATGKGTCGLVVKAVGPQQDSGGSWIAACRLR